MTGHMRGDARRRRSPETDTPADAVAHNGQLSDTDHPSLAKYRQWHEEARQEAADLRAENQRLMRERDRLAGIAERVKALAGRRVYIYKDDLIAAIEGDGGESL